MNLYDEATDELVELPAELETFRGEKVTVTRIARESAPGSSGRVELDDRRQYFPGVVGCYIADGPQK